MTQQLSVGRPSNSLHFVVGEMSGKLDQVLQTLLNDRARVDTLEGRVGKLEVWRWKIVGGGSLIMVLLGSVEAWRYVSGR
jgi:hypothetical protein